MISIAFFNNCGGVIKTSLVYHLAWMFAELGHRVLAVDLDPQANLSTMALDEERLEALWPDDEHPQTLHGAVAPLFAGTGDIQPAHIEVLTDRLGLLVGDLALSRIEEDLSTEWPRCLEGRERAFRVTTAFWRVIREAARRHAADLVLIDVGPSLGVFNRAALMASSHVVVPVAPDLFSLHGLRNLGPALRRWREEWDERRQRNPNAALALPGGKMRAVGYIVMQHAMRLDRQVKAYERWMARIPDAFRQDVLDEAPLAVTIATDPYCLAALKHYRSLMPLAQDARKPMFLLKPADGAIGSHTQAAHDCYTDFQKLARKLAQHIGVSLP